MTLKHSSLSAGRWLPDEANMIRVDHFTGSLLLCDDEANQLRALLNELLADVQPMPLVEAQRLVSEYQDLVAEMVG